LAFVLLSVKRSDIQILRGLAVLAVVAFHFSERYFPNGYLGVDIFFVISGYVVAKSLIKINQDEIFVGRVRLKGLKSFILRRFMRLAPALGVMVSGSALLMLFLIPPDNLNKFLGQGFFSIFAMGNLGAILIVGDYFRPSPNPLVHTWSLGVEEQIYFVIGTIFYLQSKVFKKLISNRIATINFFTFFITSLVLFLTVWTWNSLSKFELIETFNFYFWSQRLWEFSLGAFLYSATLRKNVKNSKLVTRITMSILFVILFSGFVTWNRNLLIIIICFLTAILILFSQFDSNSVFAKSGTFIGDRSYSIYLIHMPILYTVHYSPILSDGRNFKTLEVFSLAVVFFLAMILYNLIENRFRISSSIKEINPSQFKRSIKLSIAQPVLTLTVVFLIVNTFQFVPNKNPLPPIDPSTKLTNCKSDIGIAFCSDLKQAAYPEVLLIGDSHARYLSQTFLTAAIRTKRMAYISTQSGCEYLLPRYASGGMFESISKVYGTRQRNEDDSCFVHNEKILDFVGERKGIRVFVSLRSSSLVEMDYGITPSVYNDRLLLSLKLLNERGARVVLIGPNPEFSDGNRFFAGNTLFWQKVYETDSRFTSPKRSMRANPFEDTNYFTKKTKLLGIDFIDTVGIFCDSYICRRAENGVWLYANVDHLSAAGNHLLQPKIESKMLS
jgi:peptidoglycan/LPS O-acetylase OafA/YrhL